MIDKPGKGSFHATDLQQILFDRGSKTLVVCERYPRGLRAPPSGEANDTAMSAVLSDCVASRSRFQRVDPGE